MKIRNIILIKYLIVLFASAILFSCSSIHYDEMVIIGNIKEKQNIVFNIDKDRPVHSVLIKLIGEIEGTAVLNIVSNEGIQDTLKLGKGAIDQSINKEWYSDKCILEYKPLDVKSGQITIKYKIKYIK
ncbi:MAG: hypothetical protein AB1414_17925 [bacterium]